MLAEASVLSLIRIFPLTPIPPRSITASHYKAKLLLKIPYGACEKVASDLGMGGGLPGTPVSSPLYNWLVTARQYGRKGGEKRNSKLLKKSHYAKLKNDNRESSSVLYCKVNHYTIHLRLYHGHGT